MHRHLLFIAAALLSFGAGCVTLKPVASPPTAPEPVTDSGYIGGQETSVGPALDMSGRGLTAIPSSVFSRTDLERLDLSGNRLTGAPQAEIRHLQELRFLDLSGNALTGLPAELGQLKRLEVLDVSDNQLTGLPLELGNLSGLRLLDVTGNSYSAYDLDLIAARLPNTEIRR